MAYTKAELDIARKVKEQWGTKQDFIEIVEQMRVKEAPVVPEVPIEEVVEEPVPVPVEPEAEEWLVWFVAETKEKLAERIETWKEIKERFEEKIKPTWEIARLKEEWKLGAAFLQSLKESADVVAWIPLEVTGQLVWAWFDVVAEWIENIIQEVTPEVAEEAIEWTVKFIAESQPVQDTVKWWGGFREAHPDLARRLEAIWNIAQLLPAQAVWKAVVKPFSKKAVATAVKEAEQWLKDTGRAILNIPGKTTAKEAFDLSKFFAEKVKPTEFLDDVAEQFTKVWGDAIKTLDNSLKWVSKTFKPLWAKEVLNVIKDNLEKGIKAWTMPFTTGQLKDVKWLLTKFSKEWLTLTELNKIKRSISDYTRTWTAAGKEAAWVAPEAMRGKYKEVMKFIEDTAKAEWVPNVKDLNQQWIKSNTLQELLSKQATTIWKKKGMEQLAKPWFFMSKVEGLRTIAQYPIKWLIPWPKQTLADINLKDALEAIKKISTRTEKKTFQEFIKGKITK